MDARYSSVRYDVLVVVVVGLVGWFGRCALTGQTDIVLAEGAAVATAFGDVDVVFVVVVARVLSGTIEMLVTGEEGLSLERGRLGKVGWQVGSRVARSGLLLLWQHRCSWFGGPGGVPCGFSDVHAYSVSALGNGATLTTGSPSRSSQH